ncbi:MAG TPA: hypothetical protein VF008_11555 [Niastella sp.]
MKKSIPVFMLFIASLLTSTSYAGVISGGTAGTEVWCEQTATAYEWSEPYFWNITATSPVTINFTATPTAPDGGCSWELSNFNLTGPGYAWTYNLLLYDWEDYHTETWNEEVNPGTLGMAGGAWDATLNITVTWGWPE